jgi:HEAT repeat protein
LNDVKDDVRWNAAIALARLGDATGAEMLLKVIDREQLNAVNDMTIEQKRELLVAAVQSLGLLKYEAARDTIRQLSETDPDLSVRNASIEAMKKF